MDPYTVSLAFTGAVAAYVVLLYAHRRIPRRPTPDSIQQLRADFYDLTEQFDDFVQRHDETVGRSHAKLAHLRRKLRKLQEDEGLEPEDIEEGYEAAPAPTVLNLPPTRDQQKAALRAAVRQKGAAG